MRKGLIIAALLALGCNAPLHSFPCELYVDPSFTDAEALLIQEAVDEWSTATRGAVDMRLHQGVAPPLEHYIDHVTVTDREKTKLGYAGRPTYGPLGMPTPAAGIEIYVKHIARAADSDYNPYSYEVVFRATVLHELGHHFGIPHSKDPMTLMYPKLQRNCITEADVATFCQLHSCDFPPQSTHDCATVD